ncbi:hypothetical protein G3485_23235 [Shewanella baltica]|uniref:hypothetical protein n=1 Tax=Shewanella baltica TaxID=62322 RepID=UPI000673DF77|nr:hypothetical protein [Shewanella baltica]MCS6130001.1 hypothetical protein [Shewanella baltica]MCS6141913.1 hypothetical protein [Shewanella baltica]MCS6148248.1 hypothetical protein [Shewanella baltica]MCS6172801.1 hypothetical protein [Shewanella baltica]MCS6189999.1 hypothetical protein [Shewanella baltica]
MATRFILRSRLSTEHHYAFKPSPCLKRIELPLNEQIFNTIGINSLKPSYIKSGNLLSYSSAK